MSEIFHSHRLMHIAIVLVASVYLFLQMDQGWIPHDEGLLGQSAERVMQGQRSHVDFDDPYTGGLAVMHAAAFHLLGISSYSTRIVLLLFSIPFVSVVYLLASRIAMPWIAALITLLAVVWSVPNYFAGLPSWYNLFFAIFGTWLLIKYDESNRKAWLVAAGVAGGLSFLIKLSGLFFVAAGLLFLVYREQESHLSEGEEPKGSRAFAVFNTGALSLFVLALILFIRKRFTVMDGFHFVVPGVALSTLLIGNEWQQRHSDSLLRFKHLFTSLAWFCVGIIIPIAAFLVPYLATGTLDDFIRGVFVLPQKRIQWTDYPMPPLNSLIASVPFFILLLVPLFIHRTIRNPWITALVAVAALLGVLLGSDESLYNTIWNTTRPMVPIAAVVGCVMLGRRKGDWATRSQKRLLFLLIAVSATISLIQFPYSFGIYFCYAAPTAILAISAIVLLQPTAPRPIHLVVLLFYFGFAILWLNHGHVRRIGVQYAARNYDTRAKIPRLGLEISQSQASLYEQVLAEIRDHSFEGSYIYAANDCPEIYFLSGRKNPTRTFYEFFDSDYTSDTKARIERIAKTLAQHNVQVIVFHWQGEFSGVISYEFAAEIAKQYPNAKHIFREPQQPGAEPVFTVAWRR